MSVFETLMFEVASSDGSGSYTVVAQGKPGEIRIHCNCAAGSKGQYCKHRFNLLDSSTDGILSGNANELPTLIGWLSGSRLEKALAMRNVAERELNAAKAKIKKANNEIAKVMREG